MKRRRFMAGVYNLRSLLCSRRHADANLEVPYAGRHARDRPCVCRRRHPAAERARSGAQLAPKAPEKGDAIRVKGCLNGPTLESIETVVTDEIGKTAGPMTYQLRGDKDLLKRMRSEHDGKQVEVEGILKSTLPQDDAARSKTVGKTRSPSGSGPNGGAGRAGRALGVAGAGGEILRRAPEPAAADDRHSERSRAA